MRWFAAIPATLVMLGACTLFTDLDGFTDPSAIADASASAADATADTSTGTDGAVTTDAGDAAKPLCTPGLHAFCADFEQGTLLSTWDSTFIDLDGGKVELTTLRAAAGARSMLTVMPRRADLNVANYAQVVKKIPTSWRRTRLELDLFVELPAWQQGDINSGFYTLSFGSDAASLSVTTSIGATYHTLGVTDEPLVSGGKVPENQWVHVIIDVDFLAKKVTHTLGTETFTSPLPNKVEGANGVLVLELGVIGFNDPVPELRFFYDNVTVDFP